MRRRRKDLWDQPWVMIAAVAGVIIVIVIALLFFMGGSSSSVPASSSGTVPGTTPASPSLKTTSQAPSSSTGISSSVIKEQTTAAVPEQGVYVKVSYLGSFSGTYGAGDTKETVRDSGERAYLIENPSGTVSASFKKQDGSTKHEMTVEIWKDGKAVKFGRNASAYGQVSINYPL